MGTAETVDQVHTLNSVVEQFKGMVMRQKEKLTSDFQGIYSWRNRNGTWLFEIEVTDEVTWRSSPSNAPMTYKLLIEERDFISLVEKKIDPMSLISSGKLDIEIDARSGSEDCQTHIQKLLNKIFNKAQIDNDIRYLLEKQSLQADQFKSCRVVPNEDCLMDYIKSGSPLILENGCKHWPLYSLEINEILRLVGNDQEITLLMDEHDPEHNRTADYKTAMLGDYVRGLYRGVKAYSDSYMAANTVPEPLRNLYHYPNVFERRAFNTPRWWIGPKNTGLKLHRDLVDNFLYQLKGRKRVHLFSPSETSYLYPVVYGGNPFYEPSAVNMFDADLDRHPKFSLASSVSCELEPGNMLYLPAGWWHCVVNLEVSWSLNFFAVNQMPFVVKDISNIEDRL